MVTVAQLVRASVCGTEGRGFDPRQSPQIVNGHSLERVAGISGGTMQFAPPLDEKPGISGPSGV